ncbi:m140R [Myxoma virus]|uniref:M140R n=2 Tax=Myxoma virus TaxID=10273 RepID=Q9Q8G2_MYXVL|nr:m140R [Myxoma virus]ACB28935.1 m140R [recombinant virus 6918VP60-T2]AAF15028.1 m140R [Myxoma virus]ACB28763.1 m140R [Myxoma virus]AFU77741.1 m140R [Myxoma virus]AFU78408.1 m140R [Myxoma virus]
MTGRYAIRLLESIRNLQDKTTLCDVTLVTDDDVSIHAHKLILSASSTYFEYMFSHDFIEKDRNVINVCVEYRALLPLINFIYSGTLRLTDDTVDCILVAADYLQILEASELAENFILARLRAENCLHYYEFSKRYNRRHIFNVVITTIIHNIVSVLRQPNFKTIELCDLQNILSSDDLNVIDEDVCAVVLVTWLKQNNMEDCPSVLLEQVRMSLLSMSVKNLLLKTPCIRNKRYVQSLAKLDHSPRPPTQGCILSIGGRKYYDDITSSPVELYSPVDDVWTTVSYLPTHRQFFSVAVLDFVVYVVGGLQDSVSVASVSSYDVKTNEWKECPPLKSPRHGCGLVVLRDKLIVIGGKGRNSYLKDVDYWRPTYATWRKLCSLREARTNVGAAVVRNKVYTIGGIRSVEEPSRLECIDTVECLQNNKWVAKKSLPEPKACLAVAPYKHFIYAAGGYAINGRGTVVTKTNTLYMYNVELDDWFYLPMMELSRNDASLCVLGKDLYVVGGFVGSGYTNSVEKYNHKTNNWERIIPCKSPKYGHCSVVLNHECPWKHLR